MSGLNLEPGPSHSLSGVTNADRQRTRTFRTVRAVRRGAQRNWVNLLGVAVVVVFLAVMVGVTLAHRHTNATPADGSGSTTVDSAAPPGIQTGAAPWQPEYAHLPARLAALRLPPNGDESYHIHAHMAVYVDGQPVTVPADIGISAAAGLESPMHTHDTTGVVHIEASQPSNAFTLGAFLDLWGVSFTGDQLGGYHNTQDKAVHVYANGQPITDPARYPLHRHDDIVIGYGSPNSFPHAVSFTWPDGE